MTAPTTKDTAATEADMRAFGASDAACVKWPDNTPEHVALRAAYCEGAFDAPVDTTEWISRDDHIAAVGAIRAEGVERYLAATSLLAARDKPIAEAIAALEPFAKGAKEIPANWPDHRALLIDENHPENPKRHSLLLSFVSDYRAAGPAIANLKAALPPKEPTDAPSTSSTE